MKIVQSFWSGNQTDFSNSYGWAHFKYNWMSWILSCHQLLKFHQVVELYTDTFGYEILIKVLKLPYTKVHVVLDELNSYDRNNWAVAKLKTFQLQNEPFIHVDGDVFVWESLTDKFKDSNLVAQNLEITTEYYRGRWDVIYPKLKYLPEIMKKYHMGESNFACNMGIVGGNNYAFFKEFTSKSFEFVNMNRLPNNDYENLNFNIFFEQVLFHELVIENGENVDYLFSDVSLDNDYKGFGDFNQVPEQSYLHLLGVYKRNYSVCKGMEVYIMKYYPLEYSTLSKFINAQDKNNIEIDFLDPFVISCLINEFKNELKSFSFSADFFLLKRDLYNENSTMKFNQLINLKKDFTIVKLLGFDEKLIEDDDNQEWAVLEIHELNSSARIYDTDNIDCIILDELQKPIRFFNFIENIKLYFDDDEAECAKNEFINLIVQRLRNFIVLKIISIY